MTETNNNLCSTWMSLLRGANLPVFTQNHLKLRKELCAGITHSVCVLSLESWWDNKKLKLKSSFTAFPDGSVYMGQQLIGFLIKCELQRGYELLFHDNEAAS